MRVVNHVCFGSRSITAHFSSRGHLEFHVLWEPSVEFTSLDDALACWSDLGLGDRHVLHTIKFDKALIHEPIVASETRLGSTMNFARFYMHVLLPAVQRVIFLDVDMIVQADLSELWHTHIQSEQGHFMAAAKRIHNKSMLTQFTAFDKVSELYAAYYGKPFDCSECYSAGVMMLDLSAWRALNKTAEVEHWMRVRATNNTHDTVLWTMGTQPLMQLVSCHQWTPVSERWNIDRMGSRKTLPSAEWIVGAKILHWSSEKKPWLKISETAVRADIWWKYAREPCSGHGTCRSNQCECEANHSGKWCHL